MVDIIFYVSSTPVDATTCLCETPTDLYAEKKLGAHSREFVPGGAGTNSAACALVSAASSFLLVTLLILLLTAVLHYVLHYATNGHGRFFRLFFRVTLLGPSTVDRTCPGHDRGSASTRQGHPTSSRASVHPSLAVPQGHPRNIIGKRSGDDGSDAEDNDRGKRRRVITQKKSKAGRVRCPFKDHDPDNPEFEKCGTFDEWCRLREHLLDRKHKPRERCATCGEIFYDEIKWEQHTGVVRACQLSSRPLESPFWVDKHQAAEIRALSTRGRKNEGSIEEMHRKVRQILFGVESAPDRTASGHPPHYQPTDDLDIDHRLQKPWNILERRIGNLLGMQDVPHGTVLQIIDCVRHLLEHPGEQTHVAVDQHLGNNEMPPATPPQGQVPRIPEPEGYAARGSEGNLKHLSTYLREGASNPSPPASLDPAQASSVDHKLDNLDHGSGYVNPQAVLLRRTDAHQISWPVPNDITSSAVLSHPTSTAFTSGSAASQVSEATALESFWGQSFEDTNCLNSGEVPDSLDDFDFSVDGFSPDVGSMQLSGGDAPTSYCE